MPDWNKELSFRRRKPAAEAAPAPAKESLLKKEISFSRKPRQPKPADAVPFWKRELGGKKKERPVAPPAAEKVPFWKRELGVMKKEKPAAPPAAEKVPFWKRELGAKKKEKPAAPPAPDKVPFWKKELGGKKKAEPVAAVPAAPAAPEPAAAAPAPVPAPEPADYSWLTEKLEAYAPAPAPAREQPAWPPPSDEPVVVAPWPPPAGQAPSPPPAPAAVAAPAPPPEPKAAPAVPAAAAEPKQPFWKKELALGRRRPRLPEGPVEASDLAAASLPFWKRDLSLGRAKAPKAAKQPKAAKPPKAPKEPGTPFWKRELSLGAKGAKAPKAEKAKGEPFWKRDLSFGSKGAKAPKAEKAKGEPFWKRDLALGSKGAKAPKPKPAKPGAGAPAQKKENATFVGLKIGASQVAAARVHNNGAPQLLQVAREELGDGVVVGGELRDVEALAETLKRFFARHKLPKKGIRLGIANNRVGVRTFEIAGIDDPRQLANAIRFRAQETLPIPLEEAVLDWQVLREEVSDEGVTTRRVLLVVAYRELVDRYVLACKKAGLRLEGIDLEAFAVLRALSDPAAEGDAPLGAQVVVNVGHDRSTFAVTDGRVCEFTRVLAWGGQNLNVAIARALDLTPSEASPYKHAVSLVDSSVALENVTADAAAVICDAVRTELQAFARELVSSLRFYQNQPGSLGIAELLLTGGTAELDGLAAELQSLTGVVVRVGDPFHRVTLAKKLREPEQVGSLAVAIGLGIED